MKRPKLLIAAAQHWASMSKKKRTRALSTIETEEAELNDARLAGDSTYSYHQHIKVLGEYLIAKRKADAKCT